ncbi:hypothetical protein [Metabacillus indicus]|uniref:hypothetical protein n=1 Tax=Metabacillus indicus TaxID=246786 RepID=UPI00249127E3|nr:hypothetical protein [Metabacillus indicus]
MFKEINEWIKKLSNEIFKSNQDLMIGVTRVILRTLPFYRTLNELTKVLEKNRTDLDEKIELAHHSLENTSNVLKELEEILTKNTEDLTKLKSDYERLSALTEIEENKAQAILSEITHTVNKGKTKERWIAVFISLITGFIIFILGIWLGPIITDSLKITNK